MTFTAGLVIGLIAGCFTGELIALGSLAALHWAAERRDSALESEGEA